jgi:hypothetical protein
MTRKTKGVPMNPEIDVEKIRELLKDVRHGIDYEFHGKCRCELLTKCSQALSLLPPESEKTFPSARAIFQKYIPKSLEKPVSQEPIKKWQIHLESATKKEFYTKLRALIPEDLFERTKISQEPAKQAEPPDYVNEYFRSNRVDRNEKADSVIEKLCDRLETAEKKYKNLNSINTQHVRKSQKFEMECNKLQDKIKRLEKALQYCREHWGEWDGIHDCTGQSCVICNIERIINAEEAETENKK